MNWFKKAMMLLLVLSVLTVAYGPDAAYAASEKAQKKLTLAGMETWSKPKAVLDVNKMGNMSGWDPANWVNPPGDTIKIAVFWPHSGPAAVNGEYAWASISYAVYDINQRGGLFVDGKKKKIALFKADNMSKQDQAKKVCERMVLQEKVHVIIGTSGSNMMKVANEVANRYKVIAQNIGSLSDELQDATNFGRYSFMTSDTCNQIGRGLAYYYGQIRKRKRNSISCARLLFWSRYG